MKLARSILLLVRIVCVTIMLGLVSCASNAPSDPDGFDPQVTNSETLYPEINSLLRGNFAIPEDYISRPFQGHRRIWGSPECLRRVFESGELELDLIQKPVFIVEPSRNVAQVGPRSFSIEEELESMPKGGEWNSTVRRFQWGSFPVLEVETTRRDLGSVQLAYIGLNRDGAALLVNYRTPSDGRNEALESEIWNTFLEESRAVPSADSSSGALSKALGYDREVGVTTVTQVWGRLRVEAQLDSSGCWGLRIEPETSGMSIEVHQVETGFEHEGEPTARIVLHCVAHPHHGRDTILVAARQVEEIDLGGQVLHASSALRICSSSRSVSVSKALAQ